MKQLFVLIGFAVSLIGFGFSGCGSPPAKPERPNGPAENGDATEHGHPHADHSAMDKVEAELAKLPPGDRESAQRQHVCPVSGEMLGTMGPPLKVDVHGEDVWICCEACREPLLDNPEEYLARLRNPQ